MLYTLRVLCALRITQLLLVLLSTCVAQVPIVLEFANGLLYYVRYGFALLFIVIPGIQQLSVTTYCACCLCTKHLCELWVLPSELHLASEL